MIANLKIPPLPTTAKVAVLPAPTKRRNDSHAAMLRVANIRKTKWLRSALVSVTGSLASACVLEQILYWHSSTPNGTSRLKVLYEDDYWLVKSREEMMLETGVTVKQYKTAIAKLCSLGLIDYRIGGFQGRPTPFIRLDSVRLENTLSLPPLGQKGPNDWALSDQSNTTTLTTGMAYPTDMQPACAGNALPQPQPSGEESDTMAKGPTSSTILLEQIKSGNLGLKKPTSKPNTLASARDIWRTVPKYNDTVKMMPEMTMKQRGQLSYMVKQWGTTADATLRYIVQHWIGYTKFVAAQRGLKLTPNAPDLGFLQKYLGDAASYAKQGMSQESAGAQQHSSVAVQSIAPKTAPKTLLKNTIPKPAPTPVPGQVAKEQPSEAEDVASLEDVLAWKDKLKE